MVAAAFARYVSISVSNRTDSLLIAETWDHLRDALLLHLSSRPGLELDVALENEWFEDDDGFQISSENNTMRTEAAIEICRGMEAIMDKGNPTIGMYKELHARSKTTPQLNDFK